MVNLLLILLIVGLYVFTSRQDALGTMAALQHSPVYRGQGENKVALQFNVSWNAASLDSI